jgi:hypothetical protein
MRSQSHISHHTDAPKSPPDQAVAPSKKQQVTPAAPNGGLVAKETKEQK